MHASEEHLTSSSTPRKKKRATRNPSRLLARHAVEAALEKKGYDITVMDVRTVTGVADYFVLCTGGSDLQIKAVADAVVERIRTECQEKPWHVEGYDHLQWVLLDYVDLVVHVFTGEKREFYGLERLWGDAPTERVPDDGDVSDVQLLRDDATPPQPSNG